MGDPDPNDGLLRDKQGNIINARGYLIDPINGNIINSHNGAVMFPKNDIDERGEVPAPFCIEKHNFNAHKVMGEFDFDANGKPKIPKNKKGLCLDK